MKAAAYQRLRAQQNAFLKDRNTKRIKKEQVFLTPLLNIKMFLLKNTNMWCFFFFILIKILHCSYNGLCRTWIFQDQVWELVLKVNPK